MSPDPDPSATALPERPAETPAAAAPPSPSPAQPAPPDAEPAEEPPKYDFDSLIAEGAEGRVYVVRDRDLERRLAMKVMRPGTAGDMRRMQRFLEEARRTAALAHAGIPAVHDLGYVATGEMFFTMRLVEGRTLREVFHARAIGDPQALREWSLVRLVQVIQQVAAAVDYAHCQGILHRDLKPENIAVSEFQEVLVLDWGLSKRIGVDGEPVPAAAANNPFATQLGVAKGTPLYMAPEQARGAIDRLDGRADVFSLGAILYEALCHEPPYDGTTSKEVLQNARLARIVPIAQRPHGASAPRALVETCTRALAAEPDGRHAGAKEFAEDLQAFLEGTKEREIRARETTTLVESARRLEQRARSLVEDAARMDAMAADLRRTLRPWAPEEEKRRLWQLEDGASRTRVEAADTHARATDVASRALALDAEHRGARALLARLYYDRFVHAEASGRDDDATWLRRMVERYDDGDLAERLRDRAALAVECDPPGATVTLVRVVERDRRKVETDARSPVSSPLVDEALAPGDWSVHVRHKDRVEACVPVHLERGERHGMRLRLPRRGALPPEFVFVAGGPFRTGHGAETGVAEVPDFGILSRPVLLREYALWLDELAAMDLDQAAAHAPWVESHGALLRYADGRHAFCPASPLSRKPLVEHPDLPVVGITRASAEAYAKWLGARGGFDLRLPTELQWEKAARGTDGRLYPWGDSFDAAFCSMAESTEGAPNLRPACVFSADVSPYGVRDMAGGVREWCRDDVDEGRRLAVCRGGAWYLRGRECLVTSRWLVDAETRNPGIGFRLCCEIPST